MKGLRFLHRSLAVVFAYGELVYDSVKKRQLLPETLLSSSVMNCNKPKLVLWSTVLGNYITYSKLHATRIYIWKFFYFFCMNGDFLDTFLVMNLPELLDACFLPLALKS